MPNVGTTAESNVLKGQHVRYIPKKRLHFNFNSPEGPLSLIYQAGPSLLVNAKMWKMSTMITLPAGSLAYYALAAT